MKLESLIRLFELSLYENSLTNTMGFEFIIKADRFSVLSVVQTHSKCRNASIFISLFVIHIFLLEVIHYNRRNIYLI